VKQTTHTLLTITLLLTLSVTEAEAANRFVSGIPIPLRAEPDSANRKILQLLPVGTEIKISNKQKNGFHQATSPSGTTGWIPTRYLSKESPFPARDKPANGEKRVELELENSRLKGTINSLQQEKQLIEAEVQKLKEQTRRANQEATTIRNVSASALELDDENHHLREQARTQKRDLEVLQQENEALQDRKERDWFLVGTLVVLLSLFSGFFLARLRSGSSRSRV